MEITTKQYEELISRDAVQAAFKPREEWTIEEYRVWVQIAEGLLKQAREENEELKAFNEKLKAFIKEQGRQLLRERGVI